MPVEYEAQKPPDGAVSPICSNQPGTTDFICSTGAKRFYQDTIPPIFHFRDFMLKPDFEQWAAHKVFNRDIAEMKLRAGEQNSEEIENWILKAVEADELNDLKWHLACDYALYAKFFKRKGDLSKASENLGKTIDIFKQCGADGWVMKYEKVLAALQ